MKQQGFTLIEFLIAMALGGLVTAAVAPPIYQVATTAPRSNLMEVALVDMDKAAHWLSRDLVVVQSTDLLPGATPVPQVTLSWQDLTNWAVQAGTIFHSATYCFNGTSDVPPCDAQSTSELRRDYDGQVSTVAKYITAAGFSQSGKMLTITLTSRPPGLRTAETRTYTIYLRAAP